MFDLISAIRQLLPPHWRKARTIGLARVLFVPMMYVFAQIAAARRRLLTQVNYTGQVVLLEDLINQTLAGTVVGSVYILDGDNSSVDFQVIVPTGVSTAQRATIEGLVARYKQPGKRYVVREEARYVQNLIVQAFAWREGYPFLDSTHLRWDISRPGVQRTKVFKNGALVLDAYLNYQGTEQRYATAATDEPNATFVVEVGALSATLVRGTGAPGGAPPPQEPDEQPGPPPQQGESIPYTKRFVDMGPARTNSSRIRLNVVREAERALVSDQSGYVAPGGYFTHYWVDDVYVGSSLQNVAVDLNRVYVVDKIVTKLAGTVTPGGGRRFDFWPYSIKNPNRDPSGILYIEQEVVSTYSASRPQDFQKRSHPLGVLLPVQLEAYVRSNLWSASLLGEGPEFSLPANRLWGGVAPDGQTARADQQRRGWKFWDAHPDFAVMANHELMSVEADSVPSSPTNIFRNPSNGAHEATTYEHGRAAAGRSGRRYWLYQFSQLTENGIPDRSPVMLGYFDGLRVVNPSAKIVGEYGQFPSGRYQADFNFSVDGLRNPRSANWRDRYASQAEARKNPNGSPNAWFQPIHNGRGYSDVLGQLIQYYPQTIGTDHVLCNMHTMDVMLRQDPANKPVAFMWHKREDNGQAIYGITHEWEQRTTAPAGLIRQNGHLITPGTAMETLAVDATLRGCGAVVWDNHQMYLNNPNAIRPTDGNYYSNWFPDQAGQPKPGPANGRFRPLCPHAPVDAAHMGIWKANEMLRWLNTDNPDWRYLDYSLDAGATWFQMPADGSWVLDAAHLEKPVVMELTANGRRAVWVFDDYAKPFHKQTVRVRLSDGRTTDIILSGKGVYVLLVGAQIGGGGVPDQTPPPPAPAPEPTPTPGPSLKRRAGVIQVETRADNDNFNQWRAVADAAGAKGCKTMGLTICWDIVRQQAGGAPDWTGINRYLTYCRQQGWDVYARIQVSREIWNLNGYIRDDARMVCQDGQPMEFATRTSYSLHHAESRANAENFVREVATYLKANWGDLVVAWGVVNSPIAELEYKQAAWVAPGNNTQVAKVYDYSVHAIAAFRQYLRELYNNNVGALQAEWGGVTFDTVVPPRNQSANPEQCFGGRQGRIWYQFRSQALRNLFTQPMLAVLNSVDPRVLTVVDFGSTYDSLSNRRGTIDSYALAQGYAVVKQNDAPGYNHLMSCDIGLRNRSSEKRAWTEVDYSGGGTNGQRAAHVRDYFARGGDAVFFFVTGWNQGNINNLNETLTLAGFPGILDPPVVRTAPAGNVQFDLANAMSTGFAQSGEEQKWRNASANGANVVTTSGNQNFV